MRFILALTLLFASYPAAAQNLWDLDPPGPLGGCYAPGIDQLLCVPPSLPRARDCAKHTVAEERIKCLEDTLDTLAQQLPNLIDKEVERRLTPRLYRNGPRG